MISAKFLPLLTGFLGMCLLLLAGVYGTTTELVFGVPLILLSIAVSGLMAILAMASKLRTNWVLGIGVLSALLYFGIRAHDSLISLYSLADLSLVGLAFVGWCFGYFSSRSPLISKFFVLAVSGLAAANLAVAAMQVASPGWNILGLVHPNDGQVTGLFYHRNYFGCFSVVSSLILFSFAFWSKYHKAAKVVLALLGVASSGAILLSESRGALLAAATGGLVFLAVSVLLRLRLRLKSGPLISTAIIGAVVVSLGGLGFGVAKTLSERQIDGGVDQAMSTNGRTETLWLAVQVGKDKPLLGHGARAFEYESILAWQESGLWGGTGNLNFVHNEFAQAFSDYGWVGFLLLILLLLAHLISATWNALSLSGRDLVGKVQSSWPAFICAGTGVLTALTVQANFSFVWHFPLIVLLTAACAGGVVGSTNFSELSLRASRLQKVPMLIGCVLVVLALWHVSQRTTDAFLYEQKTSKEPLSRGEWLRGYLARFPDWRFQKELAEIEKANYRQALASQAPEAVGLRDTAISEYEKAYELHPREPGLRLALADLLSEDAQFEVAEAHFQWVLENAKGREFWFNQNWIYGIHLYRRATDYYAKREHRKALATMKLSREQFDKKRMGNNSRWKTQRKNADNFIKYLETEIIPYLPDES